MSETITTAQTVNAAETAAAAEVDPHSPQDAAPSGRKDAEPVGRLKKFYWRPLAQVREFFAVLFIIRFSAVISVLGSLAILLPDQSLEALRVMAEDRAQTWRPLILFALATLLFGVMSWYWARVLLYLFRPYMFRKRAADEPKVRPLGLWAAWQLPRFFGVLPLLAASLALYWASLPVPDGDAIHHFLARNAYSALGALPLLASSWAHYLTAAPGGDPTHHFLAHCAHSGFMASVGLYVFFILRGPVFRVKRPVPAREHSRGHIRLRDLARGSWFLLLSSVTLSLVLFAFFTKTHGQAGRWLGTMAVIMLAMSSLIPLGSIGVWVGRVVHLPLISLFLLAVIIFNALDINDNHMIRHYKLPRPAQAPEFGPAFDEWLRGRADLDEYDLYPVFIISAEGGGLRAAYFSAMVMATIQDHCPAFAQHIFAISGVSGGSLGASVFTALSSRKAKNERGQRCELAGAGSEWRDKSDAVLRRDFLSPLLASALYPDLLQRALPRPDPRLDRALALEIGLQRAWANATRDEASRVNEFERDFHALWEDFPRRATPALFLNTTRVETGERMVISNLYPLSDDRFNQLTTLAELDRADKEHVLSMPLSTAAFLSARFPLVTPSGYLPVEWRDAAGNRYAKQRYVDGGYFENSGTATVYDILSSMHVGEGYKTSFDPAEEESEEGAKPAPAPAPDVRAPGSKPKFWPIIIRISNTPRPGRADGQPAPARSKYRRQGLDEILSPILTLLNTREARGDTAVRQLRTAINTLQDNGRLAEMVDFELKEDGTSLPLGWLLSESARGNMRRQLGSPKRCPLWGVVGNDCQVGRVIAIMGGFRK